MERISCEGALGAEQYVTRSKHVSSLLPFLGCLSIWWWHRCDLSGGCRAVFVATCVPRGRAEGGSRGGAGSPSLGSQVEVVALLVVVEHLLPKARGVHPGDEVLHGPGDEESGVGHHLGPHTDVSLLHEGDGVAHVLGHPQLHQQAGQAPAAEGGGREALADGQRPPAVHQPQPVQLLQQRGGAAGAEGGAGRSQVAEAAGQGADGAGQRLVLHVVLPPTQPVPPQRLHLGQVPRRRLPAHQLQPPQQLLLVVLELAHHVGDPAALRRPATAPSGAERRFPGGESPAAALLLAPCPGGGGDRRASLALLGWPRLSSALRRGCCRERRTRQTNSTPAGGARGSGCCSSLLPSLGCGGFSLRSAHRRGEPGSERRPRYGPGALRPSLEPGLRRQPFLFSAGIKSRLRHSSWEHGCSAGFLHL